MGLLIVQGEREHAIQLSKHRGSNLGKRLQNNFRVAR